jgi:hypothetical protein
MMKMLRRYQGEYGTFSFSILGAWVQDMNATVSYVHNATPTTVTFNF